MKLRKNETVKILLELEADFNVFSNPFVLLNETQRAMSLVPERDSSSKDT